MKKLQLIAFLVFVMMIPGQGRARELHFPEILSQALVHSYDLKMGRLEKEISRERITEAGSMYYPSLSLRFTNEYMSDLANDRNNTAYVGETVIPGNESTFQHSLALSAQYLLYDFGIRELKYQNAEKHIILLQHTALQQRMDLKSEVLSHFSTGLSLQKKIETWDAILNLRREAYEFTQRLVASGSKDKLEQGMAAIGVAEALQKCEALRLEMAGVLEKLACFTGEIYNGAEVRFMDFPEPAGTIASADLSKLPGILAYDVAIDQKKAEIDIARRHWLPTLNFYSSFRMYGDDRTNFLDSLESLEEKNASIGLVVNMNIFNGFSDGAKARRLEIELEKLQVEKEKKMAENKRKASTLIQKSMIARRGLENASIYRNALDNQAAMGQRLSMQQIIDKISLLQQTGAQMERQLTLALAEVERRENAMQLQILAEGTFE